MVNKDAYISLPSGALEPKEASCTRNFSSGTNAVCWYFYT